MELVFTNNLKITCTDMDSLLESQLNERFTIRTVIEALSRQEKEYHHNALHLHYCFHIIPVCAEIYDFTSNIKFVL